MFGEECVHVAAEGQQIPVSGEGYGARMNADVVVKFGTRGDIGFSLNANTEKFEVVGDWYAVKSHIDKLREAGVESGDRVSIVSAVLQKTNHAFVKKSLKKKGFKKSKLKKVFDEETGEEYLEARFTGSGF